MADRRRTGPGRFGFDGTDNSVSPLSVKALGFVTDL
jgi:hypothetical protein